MEIKYGLMQSALQISQGFFVSGKLRRFGKKQLTQVQQKKSNITSCKKSYFEYKPLSTLKTSLRIVIGDPLPLGRSHEEWAADGAEKIF